MCRFLAYLGPPVTLDALLLAPERSLLRQSYDPQYQRHGRMNADGFGVGWWDPARRPEPARYRTTRPMWTDRSFASVAGLIEAPAVVASVRSAAPGMPVDESNTHPFTSGRWLFAHNGEVEGFRGEAGTRLRRMVSDERLAAIDGSTDSELLFALALDRLDAGATPGRALVEVIAAVTEVTTGRVNLVLSDGERVAATAHGDTLFVLGGTGRVVVASEPYDDDPGWQRVDDGALVEGIPGEVSMTRLVAAKGALP